jgi:hypothetical protein
MFWKMRIRRHAGDHCCCKMVIASDGLPAARRLHPTAHRGATRDEGGSRSTMRVKGVFVILLDAEAEREDEKENKYKQREKKSHS